MKKDTITSILGLTFAVSFYVVLFHAVDPAGNWGVSLGFASMVGAIYVFSKDWGNAVEDED